MNILFKKSVQRIILLAISFLIQVAIIIFFLLQYSEYFFNFYIASLALSIVIVFIIINSKSNPSYKIAWIIPVMIFPVFGGLFYLLYGGNKLSTREKLKMAIQNIEMTHSLKQNDKIMQKLQEDNIYAKNQSEYILNYAKCPVYNNTETTYFKIGEEKFEALLKELKKAKKFIFLEYFIIQEGKMFNSILEILEEKVKQGVDVRVIYDDVGCIITLPHNYQKKLEAKGIKCKVFNPRGSFIFIIFWDIWVTMLFMYFHTFTMCYTTITILCITHWYKLSTNHTFLIFIRFLWSYFFRLIFFSFSFIQSIISTFIIN